MKPLLSFCLALFLYQLQVLLAEVSVLRSVQVIYDKSPKLRIKGSGFDVDDHDISLELGATGQSSLVVGKDYLITKDSDGDGIVLKLLGNRKWVDLAGRSPPVALILFAVKFASNPDQNLLAEPVIVAQVLAAPGINKNVDFLYQSASNELRINGTGFMGAKKVDLYFQPPLVKEVAYEDVTPYPLQNNQQVILRLRHGYKWRKIPGPLFVVIVDSGGGPVRMKGDFGALVADVVDNRYRDAMTVETTVSKQFIYADDSDVFITGYGFNPSRNALSFANGLLGNNVDYTIVSTSETAIKLRLTPGSHWNKNMANLPGALTLMAMDAGTGFMAVDLINAAKGREIAMVFERPEVHSSQQKITSTHSRELHISGTGFPLSTSGYKVALNFKPDLAEGVDYAIRVVSRTELVLTLLPGRAWRPSPGPLLLRHINTRGDVGGWMEFPGAGVLVAEVLEGDSVATEDGIEIFSMNVKVYQSAVPQKEIIITGTGFKEDLALTLDPPLQRGVDYSLQVVSRNKAVLRLMDDKKWRAEPGWLSIRSIECGGRVIYRAVEGMEGIRMAEVHADPVINPSSETLHETQGNLLVISGSGFTSAASTRITLHPSTWGDYEIVTVREYEVHVQLKPGRSWLPSSYVDQNQGQGQKSPLSVTRIDTGAGEVIFYTPVTVSYITKNS